MTKVNVVFCSMVAYQNGNNYIRFFVVTATCKRLIKEINNIYKDTYIVCHV